jgi:hypothetical protein
MFATEKGSLLVFYKLLSEKDFGISSVLYLY